MTNSRHELMQSPNHFFVTRGIFALIQSSEKDQLANKIGKTMLADRSLSWIRMLSIPAASSNSNQTPNHILDPLPCAF